MVIIPTPSPIRRTLYIPRDYVQKMCIFLSGMTLEMKIEEDDEEDIPTISLSRDDKLRLRAVGLTH